MSGKPGESERGQHLYFVLKQVFGGSSKTVAVIRLFDAQLGTHDGFTFLSRLATEFSLCTRTEAIFFKQCMANFKLGRQQSVRDTVQLLESEMYLYEKLVLTINDSVLRQEIFLQDGEKMRLLMLNLPENVRTFLQLHGGDTYSSQRDAAIRWYERTELISQDFSKVPSLSLSSMSERIEEDPEDPALGAALPSKASKPKSSPAKKDLSSIECRKCGKKGHYSRDYKSSAPSTPRQGKGSKSNSGSSNSHKPKGKGKR